MTRRNFIASAAASAAALQAATPRPTLCFFSKHLQDMSYDEVGKRLHDAGFDGVDLTVRPEGHVLPERVTEDLPRAYEAIRSHGLQVPMISTELLSASDPAARTVTDSSGAVVAGADIAIVHTQNGVRRSTVSNEAGIYRFDAVDLGRYEMKVARAGFGPFLAAEIGVQANRTTILDVRLEVGSVESDVTVSAASEETLVRDSPLRGGSSESIQGTLVVPLSAPVAWKCGPREFLRGLGESQTDHARGFQSASVERSASVPMAGTTVGTHQPGELGPPCLSIASGAALRARVSDYGFVHHGRAVSTAPAKASTI